MIIKNGYNKKPTHLKFSPGLNGIELWIEQEGLPEEVAKYQETLSYMIVYELYELMEEIKVVAGKLFGIEHNI